MKKSPLVETQTALKKWIAYAIVGTLFVCALGEAAEKESTDSIVDPTGDTPIIRPAEKSTNSDTTDKPSSNVVDRYQSGIHLAVGMALPLGNRWNDETLHSTYGDRASRTPALMLALGGILDIFLTQYWALSTGIGMVGKGVKFIDPEIDGESYDSAVHTYFYFAVPVGAKFKYKQFHAGLHLVLFVGLTGQSVYYGEHSTRTNWWDKTAWDEYRRVNFGPNLHVGYDVLSNRFCRVNLGIGWGVHVLSDWRTASATNNLDDKHMRLMNLQLNLDTYF